MEERFSLKVLTGGPPRRQVGQGPLYKTPVEVVMFVANLALEYDGKAWYCHWETDASAHTLGVSGARAVRVVVGPTDGAYSVDTANDMREALYDLADLLVCHLTDDIIDGAHDVALGLFDTVLEGKLAP